MSLDGRIATAGGDNRWITCEKAREFGQFLRLQLDAILVGSGTILTDDPELSYRGRRRRSRPLLRVILDGRLRTPVAARVLKSGPRESVLIFCRADSPQLRRRRLTQMGAEVIPVPSNASGLDLGHVLDELGRRAVLGVLVEGGSAVHWSFTAARLVDKFYFIVAPLIIGGRNAIPSVGGEGYATLANSPRFALRSCFKMGDDLVLETYPSFSRSILSPWRQ
jgi:diaminohydroxyphosphoribosylaminopyrimidine deaminase/5-amino-6-(5-phosphoribosylamino)uracil reductase